MKENRDMIGFDKIRNQLKKVVEENKVSHGYIFEGEKLAGKKSLAQEFAMALVCQQEHKPCYACSACKKAMHKNHPDIIYVTHEKENTISVEDIRTQINHDIAIKPYESNYKIYIVDEAEKMNDSAQNALLKTIEEPPAYGIIILLTSNAQKFLSTIRSRCITMKVPTVPSDMIVKYLMEEYAIPDYQANICAAFAQGNVGKAIMMAKTESFQELKEEVLLTIKRARDMSYLELVSAVKRMVSYKLVLEDYFDFMMIWYRDVLYFKATQDIDGLIFKNEAYEIKKQASLSSYSGIESIIKAIEMAKIRIKANVNLELTMELLLLTIKEN